MSRLKEHTWAYPKIESVILPVPHSEKLPVPVFVLLPSIYSDDIEILSSQSTSSNSSSECEFKECSSLPEMFSQSELNDLIRDLNLSKKSSEILASKLKEKNCL